MVSRIEVIPSEVRGYGNIVEAKSLSDFVPVESDLVYSENVYSLTALEGLRITLTASQSSISYGSSVSLSATVVEDDSPVSGVSVSFYDGSTSLGSATTNSNGVATYTTSSLTVGSHSCTAVYDEKTSNSISVTVNKLASTISLTVPASGTVGTAYTVTGTLVPTSGSVKLYENGSLKDTLTVSSGSFSKSITQSNEGTYSYYAVFEGSSTYESVTSSTGSITVSNVAPSYDGVSLTSDKSILSYADSDSCTLTAQLLDGSSSASVSGVTVEFFKGSTSLGTATTNSSGVATKTYSSTGAGDVSLTASAGTFVSETYVVEDCLFYDSAASDKTSKYSTLNADSFTHTTDCYSLVRALGESSASKYYTPAYLTDFTLPSNYEVSVDISSSTISQEMLNIVSSPVQTYQGVSEFGVLSTAVRYGLFKRVSGTGTFYTTSGSLNADEYYTFKVSVNGTSVTSTITDSGGVQKHTSTQSISQASDFQKFTIVNGGKAHTVKFKNLKVKPL